MASGNWTRSEFMSRVRADERFASFRIADRGTMPSQSARFERRCVDASEQACAHGAFGLYSVPNSIQD
jgi:hypothetical protein